MSLSPPQSNKSSSSTSLDLAAAPGSTKTTAAMTTSTKSHQIEHSLDRVDIMKVEKDENHQLVQNTSSTTIPTNIFYQTKPITNNSNIISNSSSSSNSFSHLPPQLRQLHSSAISRDFSRFHINNNTNNNNNNNNTIGSVDFRSTASSSIYQQQQRQQQQLLTPSALH
jgi:hypothetical protein